MQHAATEVESNVLTGTLTRPPPRCVHKRTDNDRLAVSARAAIIYRLMLSNLQQPSAFPTALAVRGSRLIPPPFRARGTSIIGSDRPGSKIENQQVFWINVIVQQDDEIPR
jgi:hypothetical protein